MKARSVNILFVDGKQARGAFPKRKANRVIRKARPDSLPEDCSAMLRVSPDAEAHTCADSIRDIRYRRRHGAAAATPCRAFAG